MEWAAIPFPPLSPDGKIDTVTFLEAAGGVVRMVDKFGKVFAPVKADMSGNIEKLNKVYLMDREKHSTLHDMVVAEVESTERRDTVVISLLWLTRALHFMEVFLERLLESSQKDGAPESLKDEFDSAYAVSLKRYHGWLNQKVFLLVCKMSPTRTELLRSLRGGCEDKDILDEIRSFLGNLRDNRLEINRFYAQRNLERNETV